MECEYCIGAGKVAMGKRLNNGKLSITIVRCKRCNGTGKKLTNADRIRAMSDDELANAIASNAYTGACNDFDITYDGKCCHNCEKCDAIIKWLKQPAEE